MMLFVSALLPTVTWYYYHQLSSVDYQGSILFQGFTFITVFVALAPLQNWSDITYLLFLGFYMLQTKVTISNMYLDNDNNIFHHKFFIINKQEVLAWSWLFWRLLVLGEVCYDFFHILLVRLDIFGNFLEFVYWCNLICSLR